MSYAKIGKLVEMLVSKTDSGSLDWSETLESGVFQVSFPKYSVQIRIVDGEFGPGDIEVAIFNENGDTVESVRDTELNDILADTYKKMKRMYESARRQAMGVDVALDYLMDKIEDL